MLMSSAYTACPAASYTTTLVHTASSKASDLRPQAASARRGRLSRTTLSHLSPAPHISPAPLSRTTCLQHEVNQPLARSHARQRDLAHASWPLPAAPAYLAARTRPRLAVALVCQHRGLGTQWAARHLRLCRRRAHALERHAARAAALASALRCPLPPLVAADSEQPPLLSNQDRLARCVRTTHWPASLADVAGRLAGCRQAGSQASGLALIHGRPAGTGANFSFELAMSAHEAPLRCMQWTHNHNHLISGDDSGRAPRQKEDRKSTPKGVGLRATPMPLRRAQPTPAMRACLWRRRLSVSLSQAGFRA